MFQGEATIPIPSYFLTNQNQIKMKQAIYLNEGITGKELQNRKSSTNKAVKEENTSFSFCLKQVQKHSDNFLTSFANYKKSDLTPANLLPLLTEREKKSGKFTAWLVMQLIGRFYKTQATSVEVKAAA